MFLIAKVIGLMLVVGVPTSIGGIQLYLKNNKISAAQNEVVQAIQKTVAALHKTKENFKTEITRIAAEKNELATTKNELTYVPVVIQADIEAMGAAKKTYEEKHKELQTSIVKAIAEHSESVTKKKTAIETLWSEEKTRVDGLKKVLEEKIQAAKDANAVLQTEIDKSKEEIEKTINGAFFNPATGGVSP